MKHKWMIALVALAVMSFGINLATAAEPPQVQSAPVQLTPRDLPPNLGKAIDPVDDGNESAFVDVIEHGRTATVVVKGVEVYKNRLYVYGAGKIMGYTLVNGEVETPARRWYAAAFKSKKDGLWHFLLFTDEDRFVKPEWHGEGVGIRPDMGKGSAFTHKKWLSYD